MHVRLLLLVCRKDMKPNLIGGLETLRRPVALMLALLPVGALFVSYCIVQWTFKMTAGAQITNPELSMVIEGHAAFFRDYAIPVLILSVLLAVVNLWCAFTVRLRQRATS